MSRYTLSLTLPQLRMINAALAMYEAEDHEVGEYSQSVMDRTRAAVFAAFGDDES